MEKQDENNFRAYFNDNEDFLFVLDQDGRIMEINKAVTSILGYTNEELKGQDVLNVHPPEFREKAKEIVGKMIAGERVSCPLPLLSKLNSYIPVETRVFRGRWNGEDALIGVSRNLSEFALSEDRFFKFFNNSPVLMAISEIETGLFVNVNKIFLETLGYTYTDIVGKASLELDLFTDINQREEMIERIRKGGKVESEYLIGKTKKGELIHLLFSAEKIQIKTHHYLLTSAINITNQKMVENELKLANATKDKFFSIISHDLRGPLGELMQISDLLSDTGKLTEETIALLIKTQKAMTVNTFQLLDNLLNWARYNSHRLEINPRSFFVDEIIEDSIDNIKFQAISKNIAIVADHPGHFKAFADVEMVNLITRNLFSNAIKFTPQNGTITLTDREEGDYVKISVTDTGAGISQENISRILSDDNFHSTYGTEKEKGVGLGLKLCHDFVTLNGGILSIESEVNKGSVFSFTLPVRDLSVRADLKDTPKQKKQN